MQERWALCKETSCIRRLFHEWINIAFIEQEATLQPFIEHRGRFLWNLQDEEQHVTLCGLRYWKSGLTVKLVSFSRQRRRSWEMIRDTFRLFGLYKIPPTDGTWFIIGWICHPLTSLLLCKLSARGALSIIPFKLMMMIVMSIGLRGGMSFFAHPPPRFLLWKAPENCACTVDLDLSRSVEKRLVDVCDESIWSDQPHVTHRTGLTDQQPGSKSFTVTFLSLDGSVPGIRNPLNVSSNFDPLSSPVGSMNVCPRKSLFFTRSSN